MTRGLPANLLRQRPDIRSAERRLAAQTARVGVATAELYPQFSLTGFLGLQSTSGGDLFNSDSVTWSVGLPIRWRLFEGGAVRSQIAAEQARTAQLIARYEQAVLLALTRLGMTREEAYQVVQDNAMRTWKGEADFRDLLAVDERLRAVMDEGQLAECFDPRRYLAHVDTVFSRVFEKAG